MLPSERDSLEAKRRRADQARREFRNKAQGFTEPPPKRHDWSGAYTDQEHATALNRLLDDLRGAP